MRLADLQWLPEAAPYQPQCHHMAPGDFTQPSEIKYIIRWTNKTERESHLWRDQELMTELTALECYIEHILKEQVGRV